MGKRILLNLFLLFFTVFFIVYFVIQVKSIFIDAMETEYATVTTFDETVDLKCYIVRDENLVTAASGGTYGYEVSDGEKLAKNQVIANIYTTDTEYRTQEQIDDIEEKTEILKDSSVEFNYFTLNVTKLDKDISGMITEYRNHIEKGDYSLGIQTKKDLLVTLNKRYLVVNALTDFDATLTELEQKKENLEQRTSNISGSIYSPVTGYFYSDVDGYENILTPELLKEGSVGDIINAFEIQPEAVSADTLGKIVSDFEWYTVCVTNKETAQYFSSGNYYEVSYPYSVGKTIKALLYSKIVQSDSDNVILVFQSSQTPESFNFMRNQIVQIKLDDFNGLRIRKEALRIVDGCEGVFILNGNTIEFKRANKIYENDGYYVISIKDPYEPSEGEEPMKFSYLEMYDAVINNGKDLYHGKTIG